MNTKSTAALRASVTLLISWVLSAHWQPVQCAVLSSKSSDLAAMMYFFAQEGVPVSLPLSELSDGPSVEERALKGLAYVPLADQPFHSIYAKEGFPELKEMYNAPGARDGSAIYPAIPSLNSQEKMIYFLLDTRHKATKMFKDLQSLCNIGMQLGCNATGNLLVVACEIQNSLNTPTELLDMFGFIALQLQGTEGHVYKRIPQDTATHHISRKPLETVTYEDERLHPRILWPAWVNMYMFFRNSYKICTLSNTCQVRENKECINLFTKINQVSLTYAYFVCRLLSGAAADELCPSICRSDPCATIRNAIPGTCYPIGLKIHKHDYFCFCEEGYTWETQDTPDSIGIWRTGRCVELRHDVSLKTEPCSPLEMETFCNVEGTKSCHIDRLSANRRGRCMCKQDYENDSCGFKIRGGCDLHGFTGRLRCRSHEGVGRCIESSDLSSLSKYYCQCDSSKHIRWIDSGVEECMQWLPSLWYDRSVRCGYDAHLLPNALHDYCNSVGCSEQRMRSYLAKIEAGGLACGGLGQCQPSLNGTADLSRSTAYCLCKPGRAGEKCADTFVSYVEWTPWTVCYDKGRVHPSQRTRLRFRNCLELQRKTDGSAPVCVQGETERMPCPDTAVHIKVSLTHSDYGVAAQAVISMWRVVELMVLADMLLVGLLAGVLVHHRIMLSEWGVEEENAGAAANNANA